MRNTMLEQFQVQFIGYHIMNLYNSRPLNDGQSLDDKKLLMEILARLSLIPITTYDEIEKRIMSEIDIEQYIINKEKEQEDDRS